MAHHMHVPQFHANELDVEAQAHNAIRSKSRSTVVAVTLGLAILVGLAAFMG